MVSKVKNKPKKLDTEKVRLREENAELLLDNSFLRREMQNQPFLKQRLEAAIAERDAYKKRALIAESKLRKIEKEVKSWYI